MKSRQPRCGHYSLSRVDDNYGDTTYDVYGFRSNEEFEEMPTLVARVYTARMDGEITLEGLALKPELCSKCRKLKRRNANDH